jgi:hypothetical protein
LPIISLSKILAELLPLIFLAFPNFCNTFANGFTKLQSSFQNLEAESWIAVECEEESNQEPPIYRVAQQ